MLQVSAGLLALIIARAVAPTVLVAIDFPSGSIYATDAPYDVTSGGITYLADAGLVSMSPPNSSPELSRDLFTIVFSDVDTTLRQIVDAENIGVPVNVIGVFTNVSTMVMYAEELPIYSGRISSVNWSITDDAPAVSLECSGPLAKLKQIRDRTTSPDSQQALFPADTCMDFAHDTGKTKKWGAN